MKVFTSRPLAQLTRLGSGASAVPPFCCSALSPASERPQSFKESPECLPCAARKGRCPQPATSRGGPALRTAITGGGGGSGVGLSDYTPAVESSPPGRERVTHPDIPHKPLRARRNQWAKHSRGTLWNRTIQQTCSQRHHMGETHGRAGVTAHPPAGQPDHPGKIAREGSRSLQKTRSPTGRAGVNAHALWGRDPTSANRRTTQSCPLPNRQPGNSPNIREK